MRIAVIGGTGHIGSWLVPRLVGAGHDVVVFSRGEREPYFASDTWKSVRTIEVDRAATEADGSFGERVASVGADVVVDLICFEVGSARHLVDELKGRVQHLVHCGTLWVHGVPKTRPYDETAVREPIGDYGIRKAEIERMLLEEARAGFPVSILHPGHITGPGWAPINPAGNLDPSVFARLACGEQVSLPDDGLATLQHVHVDDVAQAFALAIENPDAAVGEAFHVASREPVTLLDYAKAVAGWSGRGADIRFLSWEEWCANESEQNVALTHDHVVHSPCASVAKAERLLGFAPRFSAVAAVRDAIEGGVARRI